MPGLQETGRNDYLRCRFGAACHKRNTGAAIVMPAVGSEAKNEHLAAISCCVSKDAFAVLMLMLMLDNTGWHTSARFKRPDNIALLPLPSCTP